MHIEKSWQEAKFISRVDAMRHVFVAQHSSILLKDNLGQITSVPLSFFSRRSVGIYSTLFCFILFIDSTLDTSHDQACRSTLDSIRKASVNQQKADQYAYVLMDPQVHLKLSYNTQISGVHPTKTPPRLFTYLQLKPLDL